MLLIAVDEGGCHYKAIDLGKLSPQYLADKDGTKMQQVFQNSIQMIFKKLKWHKGKGKIITITEVDDVEPRIGQNEPFISTTSYEVQRGQQVRLAKSEGKLQTFKVADKPRDKRDKEAPQGTE